MLDQVTIEIDKNKADHGFDQQELEEFCRDITAAFIDNLEPEYNIATTPGSDVLRIRTAIIDITPSNPALNLVTTIAVFMPLDTGGAAIAVEFLDSTNGKLLAAMVDHKTGTPFHLIGGFKKNGHAREAFDQWSEDLKLALINNP